MGRGARMRTIGNVQALRFAAAFMVLVSHLQHELPEMQGSAAAGYAPWKPVFWAGGVDIFFVISGFIMYVVAERRFGQPGAAKDFLMRRLFRVVPAYWFFSFAMILAILLFRDQVAHPQLDPAHVAASLLFIPWPNAEGAYYPLLILGWTLNFEMAFYAVFALALQFKKPWGPALLATVMLAVAAVGIARPPGSGPFAFWCHPIVLAFLLGVGLGALHGKVRALAPLEGLSLALAGFAAMVAMQSMGIAGSYWSWRWAWMGLPALMVVAAAALTVDGGRPGPAKRLAMALGDASFALYLSHPFILALVKMIWVRSGFTDLTAFLWLAGLLSVATSWIVHVWFERPLTRYLTARYGGKLGAHPKTQAASA